MFVLDEDGSLVAVVCLIHQKLPLLTHRWTGLRVDLAPDGVKPCRGKYKQVKNKKKVFCFLLTLRIAGCTGTETNIALFSGLQCDVYFAPFNKDHIFHILAVSLVQ